jgi:hypothetical protein
MSFAELIPALQALPRADKLRVIQFLAGDLALDEGAELLPAGASCPTWSPFDAFDAAKTLMQMLLRSRCPAARIMNEDEE